MVEAATANADDAGLPTQRRGPDDPVVPSEGPPKALTVGKAAEMTGLSTSSIRRRIDLWVGGDRSDKALKGSGGQGATRYADRAATEALARLLSGDPDARGEVDDDPS